MGGLIGEARSLKKCHMCPLVDPSICLVGRIPSPTIVGLDQTCQYQGSAIYLSPLSLFNKGVGEWDMDDDLSKTQSQWDNYDLFWNTSSWENYYDFFLASNLVGQSLQSTAVPFGNWISSPFRSSLMMIMILWILVMVEIHIFMLCCEMILEHFISVWGCESLKITYFHNFLL